MHVSLVLVILALVIIGAGIALFLNGNHNAPKSTISQTSIASNIQTSISSTIPINSTTQSISSSTKSTSVVSSSTTSSSTTTAIKNASTYNSNFIVYDPVNISQIGAMSKFRSCQGHDFSGLDTNGTLEPRSSMKHYVQPLSRYAGSSATVAVYTPFNGTIANISTVISGGVGLEVTLLARNGGSWYFSFDHIDILPSLTVNSTVTAGQLIGYSHSTQNDNFDIELVKYPASVTNPFKLLSQPNPPYGLLQNTTFDSVFSHMSASVYVQWAPHGITPSSIIVPLQYRINNPCQCQGNIGPFCNFAASGSTNGSVMLN